MRIPAFILLVTLFFCTAGYAAEKEGFQFRKQPELQQIKPKKPVRIRLKRGAKDEYSWELNGDDADEILRIDRKLRKMLDLK